MNAGSNIELLAELFRTGLGPRPLEFIAAAKEIATASGYYNGHHAATALHVTAHWARLAECELVISMGACVGATDDHDTTPLHYAASCVRKYKEYPRITKLLIERGADINARNTGGQTPLHLAAHSGAYEVVRALLHAGARTDLRDQDGWTPDVAASHGCHSPLAAEIRNWGRKWWQLWR